MTRYNMKNRQLSWLYVNHDRREYLGGNYLIAESDSPAAPTSISDNMRPQSAVGAALLLLITPYSCRADGKPVNHELRGLWAGDHIITVNNKLSYEAYKEVEQTYQSMSLMCMDFLRGFDHQWDRTLYENAKDFWVLEPPRKKKVIV